MSRYRRVRPVITPAHKLPPAPPIPPPISTPPEDPFKTPPRSRARTRTPSDTGGDASPLAIPHNAKRNRERQGRSNAEVTTASSSEGENGVRTRREMEQTQQSQERSGSNKQTRPGEPKSLELQGHVKEPHSLEESVLPARQSSRACDSRSTSRREHKIPPPSSGSGSSRDGPTTIQAGGKGIARGMDAPVSAVNAGERRVLVRHNQSSINLPVTPATTPMDLVRAAADRLSQKVDPGASILLESFNQLGLERPIRKYEHIRDVMNSWDRDTQMGLILVPSPGNGKDEDLESSYVPKDQPGDTSAYLYYSQKPGKWSKRWITLRSDGQMLLSKKSGAKDKDSSNICHLSDFDIYSPTPKQQSQVLKPPKKICFAVKSQQKSSMFLNAADFVHYFTTDDAKLAAQWHKAVQGWRSWYLVNKVGVCDIGEKSSEVEGRGQPWSSSQSIGSAQYQPGSFKPLLAPKRYEKIDTIEDPSSPETDSSARAIHARQMSLREKMPPPLSFPKKLSKDRSGSIATDRSHQDRSDKLVQGASPREIEDATFAPTGLLGRTYSQRQKAQREKEIAEKQAGPLRPFTAGPNLLNGRTGSRGGDSSDDNSRTMRSRRDSHEMGLEKSAPASRAKPKPLLNFDDPEFREPPQHQRKGRGILPEQLPAGGLVDMATSPEVAIPIPPSTTWRRKDVGRTNTLKGANRPQFSGGPPAQQSPFTDAAEPSDEEGFTGLLARAGPTQGGSRRGRGVMNGAHAKGPMLDVSEKSRFAPGSLLAHVESAVPKDGPAIDRERWVEIDDST
ncbi:hypothetical protein FGG08_003795 [Glutinoglossum americanum]|uniref:PH domain-containing protein n=1 Tax=Glutinoglossum americanum TaxID=1670608 RepID=A0A9P8IAF2_9PEZI|nr:hypothetical protein FGG08_003795 [Glutinoglossum americanum]